MGVLGTILFNIKNMKKAKKIRAMGKAQVLSLDDEQFFDAINCVCEDAVFDINESRIPKEQKLLYSLIEFEMEVNNGGLCQFFVNSSRECAPYVSEALNEIGAIDLKKLYDSFISDNKINVNDLTSFILNDIEEYQAQTERFDFDSFDDKFYEYENLHQQIIEYARKNIEAILKQ